MLDRLDIKNIALIPELSLELQEGLNILSGETGAGKSIIIDSLNFVLGERADRTLIRHGENFARVEAHFYSEKRENLNTFFNEIGIDFDGEILLSRIMNEQGRNECRINGRTVTLSILKFLTAMLADIHGQHEHQSLLNTENHLKLLDKFAEKQILDCLSSFKNLYSEYLYIKNELASFMSEDERAKKLDVLSFQIEEIEKADIKENEEDELILSRSKLHNKEKYFNSLNCALSLLSEDENSSEVSLNQAIKALNSISDLEPLSEELAERLNSVKIEIKDVAYTLSELINNSDNVELSLEDLEKRLSLIRLLKKKYGKTENEVTQYLLSAKAEYERLSESEDKISKLEKRFHDAEKEMYGSANKLSEKRKKAAKEFEKLMLENLFDLGMKNTVFKVEFYEDEPVNSRLCECGTDSVEFLISPNLGEPLKPLSKIISGGEMSRFMLALKNITSELDGIDTMVFDEIDTGISGRIAETVAEKLYNISKGRQVIAVTHLPQLAGMADKHYLIDKIVVGENTITKVELLDEIGKIKEITRLVGGQAGSHVAEAHAKELLDGAKAFKSL